MKDDPLELHRLPRDRYASLPEAEDRLMATKELAACATGRRRSTRRDVRGGPKFADTTVRPDLVWIMGRAIVERHEEVDEVRMVLPNLHHWRVGPDTIHEDDGGTLRRDHRATRLIEATGLRRGEA